MKRQVQKWLNFGKRPNRVLTDANGRFVWEAEGGHGDFYLQQGKFQSPTNSPGEANSLSNQTEKRRRLKM